MTEPCLSLDTVRKAPVTDALLRFVVMSVGLSRGSRQLSDGVSAFGRFVVSKDGVVACFTAFGMCQYSMTEDKTTFSQANDIVTAHARAMGCEDSLAAVSVGVVPLPAHVSSAVSGAGTALLEITAAEFPSKTQSELSAAERAMLHYTCVILVHSKEELTAVDPDPVFGPGGPAHKELIRLAVEQSKRPYHPDVRFVMENGASCSLCSLPSHGIGLRFLFGSLAALLQGNLPTLEGNGPGYLVPCLYNIQVPTVGGGFFNPLDHPVVLAATQQRIIVEETFKMISQADREREGIRTSEDLGIGVPIVLDRPLSCGEMQALLGQMGGT